MNNPVDVLKITIGLNVYYAVLDRSERTKNYLHQQYFCPFSDHENHEKKSYRKDRIEKHISSCIHNPARVKYVCDVCCTSFDSPFAKSGHMRTCGQRLESKLNELIMDSESSPSESEEPQENNSESENSEYGSEEEEETINYELKIQHSKQHIMECKRHTFIRIKDAVRDEYDVAHFTEALPPHCPKRINATVMIMILN